MSGEVARFLSRFHTGTVDEVFTSGCCYWFAVILHVRFPESCIVYDPVDNHFAVRIEDRVFDITGDVTDASDEWIPWDSYADIPHRRRIIRDCIDF